MIDMPKTPRDIAMRKKHTKQSVDYNIGHIVDHVAAMQDSIKKMSTVDKKKATDTAKKAKNKVANLALLLKSK